MKFDIKNSYKFNNYNKNIIFLVIIFDNILIKYFYNNINFENIRSNKQFVKLFFWFILKILFVIYLKKC